MVDEAGKPMSPEKAINACLKEANHWDRAARSMSPEEAEIARKMGDSWLEIAVEIEKEIA